MAANSSSAEEERAGRSGRSGGLGEAPLGAEDLRSPSTSANQWIEAAAHRRAVRDVGQIVMVQQLFSTLKNALEGIRIELLAAYLVYSTGR